MHLDLGFTLYHQVLVDNYMLYRIAILQLAVGDQVFIIDVMEFDKTAEGQRLLKELFKMLFTSENTLRIGNDIFQSSLLLIVKSKEFMSK